MHCFKDVDGKVAFVCSRTGERLGYDSTWVAEHGEGSATDNTGPSTEQTRSAGDSSSVEGVPVGVYGDDTWADDATGELEELEGGEAWHEKGRGVRGWRIVSSVKILTRTVLSKIRRRRATASSEIAHRL